MSKSTDKLIQARLSSAASSSSLQFYAGQRLHAKVNPKDLKDGKLISQTTMEKVWQYHQEHPKAKKLNRKDPAVAALFAPDETPRSVIFTDHGQAFVLYRDFSQDKTEQTERGPRIHKADTRLGSGNNGSAKLAQESESGEWVAIKIVLGNKPSSHPETALARIKELYGELIIKEKRYTIQRLHHGSSLNKTIYNIFSDNPLPLDTNNPLNTIQNTLELMLSLAINLEFIHQKGILHGDLTGDNIVVDTEKNIAGYIDFDQCRIEAVNEFTGSKKQEKIKILNYISRIASKLETALPEKWIKDSLIVKFKAILEESIMGEEPLKIFIKSVLALYQEKFGKLASLDQDQLVSLNLNTIGSEPEEKIESRVQALQQKIQNRSEALGRQKSMEPSEFYEFLNKLYHEYQADPLAYFSLEFDGLASPETIEDIFKELIKELKSELKADSPASELQNEKEKIEDFRRRLHQEFVEFRNVNQILSPEDFREENNENAKKMGQMMAFYQAIQYCDLRLAELKPSKTAPPTPGKGSSKDV